MNALDESSFHASWPAKPPYRAGALDRTEPPNTDNRTAITQNNASGWHRYKNSLNKRKIEESTHRWYVLHVKGFLNSFYEQRLSELDADIVTIHLQQLGPALFNQDWQYRQYINAVEILLVDTAGLSWAKAIEWDQLKRNTALLPNSHATIARETNGLNPVEPVFHADLEEWHRTTLLTLSRELRIRRYAIKTEQSYCHWVQRFLLANPKTKTEDLDCAAAQTFLSNLVLHRNVGKSTQNLALTSLAFYFNISMRYSGVPWQGLIIYEVANRRSYQ